MSDDRPRGGLSRSARLAALPLGYAGRTALGVGKRLGGQPAETITREVQQRTAEQLFRTLGTLKGGAMKFGQAMSVLEAALPEDLIAPYRDELTQLQDSAPPMTTQTLRTQVAADLGPDWQQSLVWLDGAPAAAASIGQVHRGTFRDDHGTEHDVAVKVQYPDAGDALMSDLGQLASVARWAQPVFPGIEIGPLVAELQERAQEELDYRLEAEAQQTFHEAFAGDPEVVVPGVLAVGERVLVTEWLESPYSLAALAEEGSRADRDHYGELYTRFQFAGPERTGMLHADPHPGNFRVVPADGDHPDRLGVLDFGAVARLAEGRLPLAMGTLIRVALESEPDELVEGLRTEGFITDRVRVEPQDVLDYLAPFVEPARYERFHFTREWMRAQFERINNPRDPLFTVATQLNLPASYLLIHRTWLGGVGVLSQLDAEAPFRAIMTEHLPGFAD